MHRYDLFKARMTAQEPIRDVLRAVRRTLRSGHRVWIVGAFDLPPAGQRPTVLGPAPDGSPWGWADAPYTASWSYQVGAYIRQQATREWKIHVPAGGDVNTFERVDLHAFQGRRERSGGGPL